MSDEKEIEIKPPEQVHSVLEVEHWNLLSSGVSAITHVDEIDGDVMQTDIAFQPDLPTMMEDQPGSASRQSSSKQSQSRTKETTEIPFGATPNEFVNSNAGTLALETFQAKQKNNAGQERKKWSTKVIVVIAIIVTAGVVAGIFIAIGGGGGDDEDRSIDILDTQAPSAAPIMTETPVAEPTEASVAPVAPPTVAPTMGTTTAAPAETTPVQPTSTLEHVSEFGLNCGVADLPGRATRDPFTGEFEGFSVDLCRAIAAAAAGDPDAVSIVEVTAENRFELLQAGVVDVLASSDTITMQRDVYEPSAQAGFRFSTPYLYTGTNFAGQPDDIECLNNRDFLSAECTGINICVVSGSTHQEILENQFSEEEKAQFNVILAPSVGILFDRLRRGFCSVIIGDQIDIAETSARQFGYNGDYAVGTELLMRDPLALVTRDDTSLWSDFVSWTIEGIIRAEELNVLQVNANGMPTTEVFGSKFRTMFQRAVAAVGNYGEMYERNLASILPRSNINEINDGSTGLILPFPFGDLSATGPDPQPGSRLAEIKNRGFLRCGISRRPIFAYVDDGDLAGFDVDFCKAIAAAIFDGRTREAVRYENLEVSERFQALADGTVDVLSRITTVNIEREVQERGTEIGFDFAVPNFYDGLGFGGIPRSVICADNLDFSSESCQDLAICVAAGTTFENVLRNFGVPNKNLVLRQAGDVLGEGLSSDACNVIAGGVSDISSTNVRNSGYLGVYGTGVRVFSKDPLALVTMPDDQQWSAFVFWIVQAIFYADEKNITSETAAFQLP